MTADRERLARVLRDAYGQTAWRVQSRWDYIADAVLADLAAAGWRPPAATCACDADLMPPHRVGPGCGTYSKDATPISGGTQPGHNSVISVPPRAAVPGPDGLRDAIRRALDDELANLADDGARLSHSVVRRIEAILARDGSTEAGT